jgi:hypothetical protein
MSETEKEVRVRQLKEGYQPSNTVERGYKPDGQIPANPQPPQIGSAAVKPAGNSSNQNSDKKA